MRKLGAALGVGLGLCGAVSAPAQDSAGNGKTFADRWTLSADARARYQSVDRDRASDGKALTVRLAGRAEVAVSPRLRVLAEGETVLALNDDFDDGLRRNGRPFVPDPDGIELNRLQIEAELAPKTRVTVGRQSLALDDWRFIGVLPFRQNQQSFDAARLEFPVRTLLGAGLVDAGYIGRVNRPLSNRNPFGQFEGDSLFVNYNTPSPLGRVTLYHYRLDLVTGPDTARSDVSNRVTGARLFGRRHWDGFGLIWDAAYARQTDHAGNARDFAADYVLAELTAEPGRWDVAVRFEALGAGDGVGFQTPLASLHRFQGLADQFLQTPADGVRDSSVTLRRDFADIGPVTGIRALARHHWFDAATDGRSYGRELDIVVGGRVGSLRLDLEYADYRADSFRVDARSLALSLSCSL